MLKHYETVFILTPVLSDDQTKETVGKYRDLLKKAGAKIVNEESWGLKKLAYSIQKKSSGFYFLLQFQAEPTLIADLEVSYKRDERVLRFLTVALDKHAVAYSEKRKSKSFEKKENKEAVAS